MISLEVRSPRSMFHAFVASMTVCPSQCSPVDRGGYVGPRHCDRDDAGCCCLGDGAGRHSCAEGGDDRCEGFGAAAVGDHDPARRPAALCEPGPDRCGRHR